MLGEITGRARELSEQENTGAQQSSTGALTRQSARRVGASTQWERLADVSQAFEWNRKKLWFLVFYKSLFKIIDGRIECEGISWDVYRAKHG